MDLGTANSIIIHKDKMVVNQPSVVAIDNKTDKLLAVGEEAHQMEGKEPPGIRTVRPLRDGVIADFNAAEQMIRGLVKMVNSKRRWFSPSLRMVVCIPSGLQRTRWRPGCLHDLRAYGGSLRHRS